jgi:predicted Ser/Thr protein kinase
MNEEDVNINDVVNLLYKIKDKIDKRASNKYKHKCNYGYFDYVIRCVVFGAGLYGFENAITPLFF